MPNASEMPSLRAARRWVWLFNGLAGLRGRHHAPDTEASDRGADGFMRDACKFIERSRNEEDAPDVSPDGTRLQRVIFEVVVNQCYAAKNRQRKRGGDP